MQLSQKNWQWGDTQLNCVWYCPPTVRRTVYWICPETWISSANWTSQRNLDLVWVGLRQPQISVGWIKWPSVIQDCWDGGGASGRKERQAWGRRNCKKEEPTGWLHLHGGARCSPARPVLLPASWSRSCVALVTAVLQTASLQTSFLCVQGSCLSSTSNFKAACSGVFKRNP